VPGCSFCALLLLDADSGPHWVGTRRTALGFSPLSEEIAR
jgi:hypothetical protein